MNLEIRKESDYRNALILQDFFPSIGYGYKNGYSLHYLANKIKYCKDKPFFSKNSVNSITRYLRIALAGGTYYDKKKGKEFCLDGLLENDYYDIITEKARKGEGLKKLKKANGYDNWSEEEKEFLIKLYESGRTPKKIHQMYSRIEEFTPRTLDAVSSFLDYLRKNEEIGKQRIEWDKIKDEVYFLIEDSSKNNGYLKTVAKNLDMKYFSGQGIITKSKLSNFLKREKLKSERSNNLERRLFA